MPWPDFTELTFGYAYLRELERRHASTGGFPLAPDFIRQNDRRYRSRSRGRTSPT